MPCFKRFNIDAYANQTGHVHRPTSGRAFHSSTRLEPEVAGFLEETGQFFGFGVGFAVGLGVGLGVAFGLGFAGWSSALG